MTPRKFVDELRSLRGRHRQSRARRAASRRGGALAAALSLLLASQLLAQSAFPRLLLPTPSQTSAPPATARVFSDGGALLVQAVAVDAQDNVYVGGSANDIVQLIDFPAVYGRKASSDGDAVVAKFDRTGRPLWASFFGGNDQRAAARVPQPDTILSLAVDAAGQVYAAGSTGSTDLPVVGGFQPTPGSTTGRDAMFFKLSADGQRILYSTYFGSGDNSAFSAIHVGPANDVWLAASTGSAGSETTDLSSRTGRVVIVKLNAAGSVTWTARLPLAAVEGFAVDALGDAHAAGQCTGGCAPFLAPGSALPRAVLRLSNSGTQLRSATAIAPSTAQITGLAFGPDARLHVVGYTFDQGLPVRNAWQPAASGSNDAFVAILDPSGRVDILSYLGSRGDDIRPVVAAAAPGEFVVAMSTQSTDLATARAPLDHHVDGPVYRSLDRGVSWQPAGRGQLPTTPVADLAFDAARQALYAAATPLSTSRDAGASWQAAPPELGGVVNVDTLAFDPRNAANRYAGIAGNVYRFDDGRGAWDLVLRSAPGAYLRNIAVSPHDSSVWVGGNFGVDVSADGGVTWSRRDEGLPAAPFGPTLARVPPNVFAFHPTEPRTVYAGAGFGVYVSTNAGGSWQPLVTAGTPAPDVTGIAFDPVRPQLLHVATRNRGLLRCDDGGRSCTAHLTDQSLTAVATDPQKRHIVYAAGLGPDGIPSFHLSIDHGQSWHRSVAGFDLRGVPTDLLVDPRDSSRLFVSADAHLHVPYVARFRQTALPPQTYAPELATYLGAGAVSAIAVAPSGDIVLAITRQWRNAFAAQGALVRIGR